MKKRKVLLRTLATALLLSGGLAFAGQTAHAAKGDVAITEKNFPDSIFRGYVKKNFDKDKNGKLSLTEIADVKKIDCNAKIFDENLSKRIESIKGIEYFTNLTELDCSWNSLMSLDISKNTKLVKLDCSHNLLALLRLQNNPSLKELRAFSCLLIKLDLTQNPELTTLIVSSNALQELDVSQNKKLEDLQCHSNRLTELDVSKLPNLKVLYCCDNKIESLNINKNTKLEYLNIYYNPLTKIDIRKCPKLDEVYKNGTHRRIKDTNILKCHSGTNDYDEKNPMFCFDLETEVCPEKYVLLSCR